MRSPCESAPVCERRCRGAGTGRSGRCYGLADPSRLGSAFGVAASGWPPAGAPGPHEPGGRCGCQPAGPVRAVSGAERRPRGAACPGLAPNRRGPSRRRRATPRDMETGQPARGPAHPCRPTFTGKRGGGRRNLGAVSRAVAAIAGSVPAGRATETPHGVVAIGSGGVAQAVAAYRRGSRTANPRGSGRDGPRPMGEEESREETAQTLRSEKKPLAHYPPPPAQTPMTVGACAGSRLPAAAGKARQRYL